MDESSSTNSLSSAGRVAGWSVYLAMSWTWCIGMYLPVILMRELGIWGVIAFAIPNIVGAVAMGWALRDRRQSEQIVGQNHAAVIWFSLITIVFHAYFAAWLIRAIAGPNAGPALAACFFLFWLILHWRRGGQFLAASLVLGVSAAVMAWGFSRGELPYVAQPLPGASLSPISNLWLAPAWMLGFLCCPWLDPTFHAARQAMRRSESRRGFHTGFRRHLSGNAPDHRRVQRLAGGGVRSVALSPVGDHPGHLLDRPKLPDGGSALRSRLPGSEEKSASGDFSVSALCWWSRFFSACCFRTDSPTTESLRAN